jgi:signal transduction histidine kinase
MRPVKSFYLDSKVHLEITNAFYHRDNLYLSTEDKILVRNMQQFTTRVLPNPPKLNFGVTQVDTFHQLLNRELSYPFNLLELYFGSLSSDLANNTYIWFKIDNSDWQKGTDSNTIRLQNLSSGTHKLYTKAIDQNGLEYESQEIGFSVQYPWYYRWWAIGLGILILIFLITQIVQYLNRQRYQKKIQALTLQQELESERRRISRDLHDNMGAYTSALIANVDQLNHQYGETEQNRKMKSNAESILSSLRETIWVLNNKQISIEEFNDNFKNYCFKILRNFEQINFEAKEEISSNIEMKSIQALHLNKIMQEAIQNSIKHSQATEIIYQIKSNKNISILIQDNGIGFNKSERSSGFGMENMQWRATEANLELIIESQPMQGTIVKINTLK